MYVDVVINDIHMTEKVPVGIELLKRQLERWKQTLLEYEQSDEAFAFGHQDEINRLKGDIGRLETLLENHGKPLKHKNG